MGKLQKVALTGALATAAATVAYYEKKIKHRSYSGIEDIPEGRASRNITEGCLAVEGGSLRGLYASGVLDAFMLNDINLRTYIGVSAGAMCGFSYISGQIGRTARFNLSNRFNQQYIGLLAYAENLSPFGFKYAFSDRSNVEKFDMDRFMEEDRRYIAVATDIDSVEPVYFEKGHTEDIFMAIRASATLPTVSRPVTIDGHKYLDGGVTVNIPYRWPVDQDFEKIVVVRTREPSFRKVNADAALVPVMEQIYKSRPRLVEALKDESDRYNREVEELNALQEEGRVYVIAPSEHVTVTRMENDIEKIGSLYLLGLSDGFKQADAVKEYLGIR
ncbi:MAG: patatin family protein [Lachnospiraceae bacterium]|nr:patatin family protein [Lachnospiraceae bacterium]